MGSILTQYGIINILLTQHGIKAFTLWDEY